MDKQNGRVMAIDLGEKRIGIALSDPTRKIARAERVIKRKSRQEDFARYCQIIAESSVTLVIVGLPLLLSGEESQQTAWVRDYTADMETAVPVPVILWDEGLTTVQAEESLKLAGVRGKRLREKVDAVAAALILQSWLDVQTDV